MKSLDIIKGSLVFGSRTVVPEDLLMDADKMMCSGRFDEGVQLRELVQNARGSDRIEELEEELKDAKKETEEADEDLREAREQVEESIRRLDRLKEKLLEKLEGLGDVVPAKRLDKMCDELRDGFEDATKPLYDV